MTYLQMKVTVGRKYAVLKSVLSVQLDGTLNVISSDTLRKSAVPNSDVYPLYLLLIIDYRELYVFIS